MKTVEELKKQKDGAYWERNQLVAALSKIYPSWLGRHIGEEWEDDWRNIVFIEIPTEELFAKYVQGGFMRKMKRQISWHINDSDLEYFSHLRQGARVWDGHTTEEKYERLRLIDVKKPWWKFF